MSQFEAFGRMESENWADSSRVRHYVDLFAFAADQTVQALVDVVYAKGGRRALDVCCGHGNVTEALRTRGCDVFGLDFSQAMLDIARSRLNDVNFVHGDAQNLPFLDNDFDIVISNFGICHVPDQPRALAEAHRVMRPGGNFAMTVWCGPDVSPCFELLYNAVKSHGSPDVRLPAGPDFHQFAKLESAIQLLSAVGFSEVAVKNVDCLWRFDKPEFLCEIFEKATARAATLLAAQPPDRLSAIRSAMALAVRERFGHGSQYKVPMPAALVSARK
jgi:ubiquinone/menaquinone biosynthesis C-methylase UbiE